MKIVLITLLVVPLAFIIVPRVIVYYEMRQVYKFECWSTGHRPVRGYKIFRKRKKN